MRHHPSRSVVCLLALALGTWVCPAYGQISRRQGLGTVDGSSSFNQYRASDSLDEVYSLAVSCRIDAERNWQLCPKESVRYVSACRQLERVALRSKQELLAGGLTRETRRDFEQANRAFQFAGRDYIAGLENSMSRKYQVPRARPGYGHW